MFFLQSTPHLKICAPLSPCLSPSSSPQPTRQVVGKGSACGLEARKRLLFNEQWEFPGTSRQARDTRPWLFFVSSAQSPCLS